MKKLMVGVILLLGIALIGCGDSPVQHYRATGYVRSLWPGNEVSIPFTVVLEEPEGHMRTLRFTHIPPVWVGMHCEIDWDKQGSGNAYDVQVTRLPNA